MILDITDKNSFKNAIDVLRHGGVLVFPTDTVYGIGSLMINNAIVKLYKIKNRTENQPTAVLMSRNIFDAKRKSELILDLDKDQEFMTGKLTIIDSIKNYMIDFPGSIISADKMIGIRLPQNEWLEKLIDQVGPIVASSANKKGEPAPLKYGDLDPDIIDSADLVIKSDEIGRGQPSSIYHLALKKFLR